jgi:hypothetical protein
LRSVVSALPGDPIRVGFAPLAMAPLGRWRVRSPESRLAKREARPSTVAEGESMDTQFSIPPRSHFTTHYMQFRECVSDAAGITNLARIFNESVKLALASKSPETAVDRRDLAMDAFYQLREIMPADGSVFPGEPPTNWHQQALLVASNMLKLFPSHSAANCALGLVEKAVDLKRETLRNARLRDAEQKMAEAYANLSFAADLANEARQYLDAAKAKINVLVSGPSTTSRGPTRESSA